jgi:hypothetical protein
MSSADVFEKNGCVRVNEFLDLHTVSIVSQYFENRIRRGEWVEGDEGAQAASKLFYYADPLIEALMLACKAGVEEITGKELLPTYSYSRVYQPGEELAPHTDRPSCEVSVTVNVATKGVPSSLYTQYADNPAEEHVLNPGDAVVYKGCDALHWRKPLNSSQLNVQFMMHYVDKNGPYVGFEKDKRPVYGMSGNTRRT